MTAGTFLFPDSVSTSARVFNDLLSQIILVAAGYAVVIVAVCLWLAARYWTDAPPVPRSQDGLIRLFRLLAATISATAALFLFSWGSMAHQALRRPPPNAMPIDVEVADDEWRVTHSQGANEINEVHVPVRYPVKLVMKTKDTAPGFSVPAFRLHREWKGPAMDEFWFESLHPGVYSVSGPAPARIVAMKPVDFAHWLRTHSPPRLVQREEEKTEAAPAPAGVPESPPPAIAARPAPAVSEGSLRKDGAELFKSMGCFTCHRPDGLGSGPKLQGRFGGVASFENGESAPVDEAYVRESILDPKVRVVKGYLPLMPSFKGKVSETEMKALVAFLKSLGKRESNASP